MSTLRVTNIQSNGDTFNDVVKFVNSGDTENDRLVRAFLNPTSSSGTPSIRSNFNVNSIINNGVGDFTVNFSNALSDVNYAVSGTANSVSGSDYVFYIGFNSINGTSTPTLKTASASRLVAFSPYSGAPGAKDPDEFNAIFFR
jgi:hypothetical protein